MSWSRTLSVATVAALLVSVLIDRLLPGMATQVTEAATQLLEVLGEANPQVVQAVDVNWLRELLLGVIVASYLGTVLTSLAIARWWQSMLYNPGGFRVEFHGLRLPPLFAAVGLIVLVLANSLPGEMVRWLPVLITPFVMASIALIHGMVAQQRLRRSWLIAFYAVMFIAGPYLIALLIMLAVADSFIDFRKRLKART
jgi:ABC-type transport system involved in multi-copper enzyme maturation permease subunit